MYTVASKVQSAIAINKKIKRDFPSKYTQLLQNGLPPRWSLNGRFVKRPYNRTQGNICKTNNPEQSNVFFENGLNINRAMTYKPVGEIHQSPARKYNHNGAQREFTTRQCQFMKATAFNSRCVSINSRIAFDATFLREEGKTKEI